ncbi:MAP kinase [Desarmillaria tabescens]|uniref:MAP kinase n=1 Tax=Armillaria tabescens TaxID=1929756 RepID=A0AA39NFX4_ARMTA|nr:MAP kinase [Desarmillaria tabescens]KAK0464912.1 MAP kinase [Desarmillaria tabescens]
MSELPRFTKPRLTFHVVNPGSESESSDEDRPTNVNPYHRRAPLPNVPKSPPPAPSPLTTNMAPRIPRSQASHQSLSSPSSTSSPAADESTPPPSTPGLPIPPVDLSTDFLPQQDPTIVSYNNDRSGRNDIHISTSRNVTGKIFQQLKSPFQHRSLHTRPQPIPPVPPPVNTSPTVSTPDSYTSASSHSSTTTVSDKVSILATADSDTYVNVDISGVQSAAVIRECIFSKLHIDDDEQSRFSLYRTEIGAFAMSDALTDEKLFELCREFGDSKGTLKLLVSHSSAPVHEAAPSLPSSLSPSVNTVPPPVLPSCAPLRPRRRSSRHGSLSSASEQIPTEQAAAYDADVDADNHRTTMRPPPHPHLNTVTSVVSVPSSSGRRPSAPARPSSPLIPPRSTTPSPPTGSQSEAKQFVNWYGNLVPAPPPPPPLSSVPPPLSPLSATFDDSSLTPPATRTHGRSGSDAAAEREQALRASEQIFETAGRQWQSQLDHQPSRDNLQSKERRTRGRLEPQRRDLDESLGRPESWVVVSRDQEIPTSPPPRQSPKQTRVKNPLYPSRYRATQSGRPIVVPAPPRHPPPPVPHTSPEIRSPGTSRQAGQPVPSTYVVTWKGEEKADQKSTGTPTSSTDPWRPIRTGAKSMDNLRAAAFNGGHPPTLQPGMPRRHNGQTSMNRSNGNIPFTSGPKPYESRTPVKPLPVQGPSQRSSQYNGRTTGYPGGYMSPNQDPFPRPLSAFSDVRTAMTSPTNKYPRPTPSYSNTMEYPDSTRSPPVPSLPLSGSSRPYNNSRDVHDTTTKSPPQSPISPHSPRSTRQRMPTNNAETSSSGTVVGTPSDAASESTLGTDQRAWLLQVDPDQSESTVVPPLRLDRTSSSLPNSKPSLEMSSMELYNSSSDSDSDHADSGTWKKPFLTLDTTPSTIPSVTIQSSQSSGSQSTPVSSSQTAKLKTRGRGSTFTDTRPPPEDVYERLEDFFPEHDLDKPVIEANSGGTSPTTVEQVAEVSPEPASIAVPPIPLMVEKSRVKGKKSIRHVAEEHKRRINRTSKADSSFASSVLRKRSTKLWGSRLEEVTTAQARANMGGPSPESPNGGPTTFKWVRGEMIGRGTYGRVYLALNATTGEMIAVKQVEIPRTTSDKNDSRQVTVVQALKLESETLKDLDHPNIVQYLGFEETPSNLSIFLEYVPGGSIGSCLLKHGRFSEEVTRSFTGQILGGLEYLHSKGILHRDLKADNILVEMSGVCKISDFGISKRTDDRSGGAETAMQGTVFWMAPEVVNPQGKGYNFKVDIWSVGCVVLEMWAGTRPWQGDEMVAVMFKLYQLKQPPPVPEGIILSDLADDFRKKCFAINPEERPSAQELRKHKYLTLDPDWQFTGFN